MTHVPTKSNMIDCFSQSEDSSVWLANDLKPGSSRDLDGKQDVEGRIVYKSNLQTGLVSIQVQTKLLKVKKTLFSVVNDLCFLLYWS